MGVFFTGDRHNLALSQEEADKLTSHIEEYLGCFRLYGIDMNGNELILFSEGSGMETRALTHLVGEVEFGGPALMQEMEMILEDDDEDDDEEAFDDDDDDDKEGWQEG